MGNLATGSRSDEDAMSWLDYWQGRQNYTDVRLSLNTEFFLKRAKNLISFEPADSVLDLGCGPGETIDRLKNQVHKICGLDVSKTYTDFARRRFQGNSQVEIVRLDPQNYLAISDSVRGQKFHKILVMSVVQYYRNHAEVSQLVHELAKISLPGTKALILDIPIKGGLSLDVAGLLSVATKDLKLGQVIRAAYNEWRGDYQNHGTLNTWTLDELKELRNSLPYRSQLYYRPLTVNWGRAHLLVEY